MGKETLGVCEGAGFKTWFLGQGPGVTGAHVTVTDGEALEHLSGDIVDRCPENTPPRD